MVSQCGERRLPLNCLCQGRGWTESISGSPAPSPGPGALGPPQRCSPFSGPCSNLGPEQVSILSKCPYTQQRPHCSLSVEEIND